MEMKININRLLEERNKRAWTQAHLAEICGLSLRTIQRIEKTGVASPESTQALAAIFNLSIEDLIIQTQRKNNPSNSMGRILAIIGLLLILIIPFVIAFTAITGTTIWVDIIDSGVHKRVSSSSTLVTLIKYTPTALYTLLPGISLIVTAKYWYNYHKSWINKLLIFSIILLSFANPVVATLVASTLLIIQLKYKKDFHIVQ
jgi:transcriptional regulator with XRE-family HTH domain